MRGVVVPRLCRGTDPHHLHDPTSVTAELQRGVEVLKSAVVLMVSTGPLPLAVFDRPVTDGQVEVTFCLGVPSLGVSRGQIPGGSADDCVKAFIAWGVHRAGCPMVLGAAGHAAVITHHLVEHAERFLHGLLKLPSGVLQFRLEEAWFRLWGGEADRGSWGCAGVFGLAELPKQVQVEPRVGLRLGHLRLTTGELGGDGLHQAEKGPRLEGGG